MSDPSTSADRSTKDPKKSKGKQPDSDLSSKLDKSGKLTKEECHHHFENNLCLFCGCSGHVAKECPKSSSQAKARAAQAEDAMDSVPSNLSLLPLVDANDPRTASSSLLLCHPPASAAPPDLYHHTTTSSDPFVRATTPDHTTPEPPSLTSPHFPHPPIFTHLSQLQPAREPAGKITEFEELGVGSSTWLPGTPQVSSSEEMGLLVVDESQLVIPSSFLPPVSTPPVPSHSYLTSGPDNLIILSFDIFYNPNLPDYNFRAPDLSGCLSL
ncbi:uncharacterized protein EI90DRAFT_3125009 [Cantharellus anzutake]|uniref:uncharacterized protein n=1 Tax=Cantharellus anzutake TaxID=1750568 RepID=UPI001902F3F7|nr:uncharacterized protein EI90DRAFT_3125009 [Cantharellus anzutake]KAF8329746.1 hypothetical protein EI90DRAFT_3125009 [Cantharellus anzutake]